ncbi:MAG: methyl-accepting chemotaxis protein [Cytophagales bacterium]|nr:methyl-accepting chemotaxis protein [Cytophagales bacterium]
MDSEDYYFIGLILGLYPIFYIILKRLFGNSIIFRIAFTFVTVDVEISISCFIIGGMGIEHVFMWGLPMTLACFGLAYWHIYRVVRIPLLDITSDLAKLAEGEVTAVSERDLSRRKDEIGQIQLALKAYGQAVSRTSSFASKIQQGDLSSNYTPLGPEDLLGNSLIEMNQSLSNVILETNKVVRSAAEEGVFELKLKNDQSAGIWHELTDSVNNLLASLIAPVKEVNRVINSLADGDLTGHFMAPGKGEMGNLALNLNSAITQLNRLLEEIQSVSLKLNSHTNTLITSNREMTQSTNEIAITIGQMSEGASQQLEQIDQSSQLADRVMGLSEEISHQSQEIFRMVETGVKKGNDGIENMEDAVDAMNHLLKEAKNAVAVLDSFYDRSRKISGIVLMIQNISQQTNLLSLNASIEAAKAGDSGRGFSVVANQIRQLAAHAKASASEIEGLITSTMDDTENAMKHIRSIEYIGNQSATAVFQASGTFKEMAELSQESLKHSEVIQSNTQSQLAFMRSVADAIEGVVVIAEETATGTDQVAASAAELSAGMTEFNQRFITLGDVSTKLGEQVNRFKLRTTNNYSNS